MKKHQEKINLKKIRLISSISFLAGLAQAVFSYIMSTYFALSSGSENVGWFYLVAYSLILILYLNLHKIIRKFGKSEVFFFSLFAKICIIIALLFVSPSLGGAFLVMAFIILGNLEWTSLNIILESFSNDRMSGRIRGKFLTIMNAGILLGPFISTGILESYDYYGIFLLILIFNVVILFAGIAGLKKVNHRFKSKITSRGVLKKVLARKNIRRAFHISFALEFFYALMIIYTPIYLLSLGVSWRDIGIIFTWMLLPFVILQYPIGIMADKKWGEKEMLIVSLFIMGGATLFVYFISSSDVFLWSVVLFVTRVGAALVEILRDSYFYKRIDGHDVDYIEFFNCSKPFAYILASGVSAVFLLFFPLRSIFLLTGVVVLSALFSAFRLVDNKSERESIKERGVYAKNN
jgi:MFS family permease